MTIVSFYYLSLIPLTQRQHKFSFLSLVLKRISYKYNYIYIYILYVYVYIYYIYICVCVCLPLIFTPLLTSRRGTSSWFLKISDVDYGCGVRSFRCPVQREELRQLLELSRREAQQALGQLRRAKGAATGGWVLGPRVHSNGVDGWWIMMDFGIRKLEWMVFMDFSNGWWIIGMGQYLSLPHDWGNNHPLTSYFRIF